MIRPNRIALLSAASLAAALTVTGCGALDKLTGGSEEQKATLIAAQNDQLGAVVTDSKGHTLYRYDLDKAKPSRSNCDGECSANWIPVLAEEKTTVQGIDPRFVGAIKRSDGGMQLTLKGWPLYRFIKDKEPGDVKGQGIAGTWWATTPTGAKIKRKLQSNVPAPQGGTETGGTETGGTETGGTETGGTDTGGYGY